MIVTLDQSLILWLILFLIGVIFFLFYDNVKIRRALLKIPNLVPRELSTSLYLLNIICSNYKRFILVKEVEELRKKYSLDPNSPTNSIKLFKEELNNLYHKSIIDILKNHLTIPHVQTLNKYFNNSSIVYYILSQLTELDEESNRQ